MAPHDTEALQDRPEDVMRRVAREEARAVYDEYTVTDDDGKQWTFPEVVDTISEIEGGTTRRTFAKAALAMAYITAGGAGYTAIMQAASQPAQAAATGELGTTTEPIDKIFADEIGTSANPITAIATEALNIGSDSALISVAASGDVTLSSGTATVDTGLSATDATFYLALGVDDPDADVELAGKLFWDDSAGTYKVTIDEVDTSVGNPTANYDILRVR